MRWLSPLLITAVIVVLRSAVAASRKSAAAQEATPIVKTEGSVTLGEPDEQPLRLDVFLPPERDQPQPVVNIFHG